MIDIIREVLQHYWNYCGNNKIMFVYAISLVYLSFLGKEIRRKIVYPSLIIMAVVFNPIGYGFIFKSLLGNTYWRMMWMLPVLIVIGLALTKLIRKFHNDAIHIMIVGVFCILIMSMCENIYFGKKQFTKTDNWYKLPSQAVEVAEIILEKTDNPKCVMPNSLYSYVRQYSAEIKLLYGRDADGFISSKYDEWEDLFWLIRDGEEWGIGNFESVVRSERYYDCNVVIEHLSNAEYRDNLCQFGYERIASVENMEVYYNPSEEEAYWLLTQYGYNGSGTRMSYSLEGKNGELILIDGGHAADAWMFEDVLDKHEYHVDCWILTQFTDDHVGSFLKYQDENVSVDNVYMMEIDRTLSVNYAFENLEQQVNNFQCVLENQSNICLVGNGESYDLKGLKFEVVYCEGNSDFELLKKDTEKYYFVFSLQGDYETILFTNDADENADRFICEYLEKHPVDYLEVAYHNGRKLSSNVYAQMKPKVVFFDCSSERLFEDCGELRADFKKYGTVYDFSSVPNRLVFH